MLQDQAAARRLAIATFAISSIALFMTSLDRPSALVRRPYVERR